MGSLGAKTTNNKTISVYAEFENKVKAFTSAGKDKEKVKQSLSELKSYLNSNMQVYETNIPINDMGVKSLFNVTGNRAWYTNKSGTLFILAPNGEWLKFNKSGGVTNDGKISDKDRARVIALRDKMRAEKGR